MKHAAPVKNSTESSRWLLNIVNCPNQLDKLFCFDTLIKYIHDVVPFVIYAIIVEIQRELDNFLLVQPKDMRRI